MLHLWRLGQLKRVHNFLFKAILKTEALFYVLCWRWGLFSLEEVSVGIAGRGTFGCQGVAKTDLLFG